MCPDNIRHAVVAIALLTLAGCSDNNRANNSFGHVRGTVLAGPTCPVEQTGDTNCQPKPVQGVVQFRQDGDVVDTALIDENGEFAADIPIGSYTVTVDIGDNIFPICSPIEIEVRPEIETVADINCDTGIR